MFVKTLKCYALDFNGDQRGISFSSFALQLRSLPCEELQSRMQSLDMEMEKEIEGLRARYQAKRQPILDAMEAKKRRQQNF